jgi:hypothetical protein
MLARVGGAESEGAFGGAFDVYDAVVVMEGLLGWELVGLVREQEEDIHRPRCLFLVVDLLRT